MYTYSISRNIQIFNKHLAKLIETIQKHLIITYGGFKVNYVGNK